MTRYGGSDSSSALDDTHRGVAVVRGSSLLKFGGHGMTRIFDDPHEFAQDSLDGYVLANERYVRGVDGGVVRAARMRPDQVAVMIGGGSGHYPAFAGLVGQGLASGAACGDMFASPSASRAYRVAKAVDKGAGVLISYGNYAGDVLHFGEAEKRLRDEGIDARTVLVTDDIASSELVAQRRGIAGGLVVFKIAGAASEAGAGIDEVERLAISANAKTFTLGIAFDGCTLPGAEEPLFTVPEGHMSIGLGIHGEPGIEDMPLGTASEIAELLVGRLLAHRPEGSGDRVVPIVNGLGSVKYEELFLLYGRIAALLADEGLTIVEPECGELVTSLDMAGVSLTLFWPDDELLSLWSAPASTPAYRKGSVDAADLIDDSEIATSTGEAEREESSAESRELAKRAVSILEAVSELLQEKEDELGTLDSFAGDGDHGIGMRRGAVAAAETAKAAADNGDGLHQVLSLAAEAWSDRAGGTSGALWGAAIQAIATSLGDADAIDRQSVQRAAVAGREAILTLGKAELGDKTMVDAVVPYVDALDEQLQDDVTVVDALASAANVATQAAADTESLRPRLGRARPLAEKSVGHPDPGAVSFGMVMQTLALKIAKP
jgi:dihydroxyacetone kinase